MWSSKLTVFDRRNSDIKEALQVFCRRSMAKQAVLMALELFESRSGRAALEKLRIIALEDKFPEGSQYMSWLNRNIQTGEI